MMPKISLRFVYALVTLLLIGSFNHRQVFLKPGKTPPTPKLAGPGNDLVLTKFADSTLTPSPACLALAPTGEVFVGVDRQGSLGTKPDSGSIVRLVDTNQDGKLDRHSVFATVNNPRGLLPIGHQLFVLHAVFSPVTGKGTGMNLSVFEDKNQDGLADGPAKPLIEHISNGKMIGERGVDHATNGIRMGIDGWIYIAVGDYGFHEAVDRSGKKLTMLGGGIVRVRPDGTELEVYTHGTRNIYDVAIDPYMNIFTRGNTNDGGGWNIRFTHQIQSGEYGYPVLFQHFTDEIIPALADLGGGSGTGALFFDEPGWPATYTKVPMMADWGRNKLFIHRLTPDKASFNQQEEAFISLPQITDVDVDGSGRLYLSAWDGAGYRGSPSKGYIVRVVPRNWTYGPFPDLKKASVEELATLLTANSAVKRLHASQELLTRPTNNVTEAAYKVATAQSIPLANRVAGLFTYAQSGGEASIDGLVKLTQDADLREFALRALADRRAIAPKIPLAPFLTALRDPSKRVQVAALVGLGRLGRKEVASALLGIHVPAALAPPATDQVGAHATPNPDVIPAHMSVRALVSLNAVEPCLKAIGTNNSMLALWALRYMHSQKAVDGLIRTYGTTTDKKRKKQILTTLARLYKKEAPYDGSWWWGTRPDTHGPYYKGVVWEASPDIKKILVHEWRRATLAEKPFFAQLNGRHRMGITEFGGEDVLAVKNEVKVDLEKIKTQKGQIGKTSIEDVMIAVTTLKGDVLKGRALFAQQGCIACHSISKGEALKGPFMGQIGSIMTREQIAESILKPNASISQGFATVLIEAKGNKSYMGFITGESADQLTLRNIAGEVFRIKTSDIISRKEQATSMMPEGLANALSYEEFASLITFLSQQKQ